MYGRSGRLPPPPFLTRCVREWGSDVSGRELSTLTCMQEWSQTDWRGVKEMEREKTSMGKKKGAGASKKQRCCHNTTNLSKFGIWTIWYQRKKHQGMSENKRWALHKQMSRYIDRDGFIANLARGFWCRLGVFVGFHKQNTVAAYFSSVPVCQAVRSKERSGSNTYNGEFDTVVHF